MSCSSWRVGTSRSIWAARGSTRRMAFMLSHFLLCLTRIAAHLREPMKVENLTPMLRTWDLPGTIEFYDRVLGFQCTTHQPGWATLRCGPVSLMLSGPNQHEGDVAPTFTGSLYFRVREVDGLWLRLKDQARICYPIETFAYGMREFAIYDNNGYLLQFGEAVTDGRGGGA